MQTLGPLHYGGSYHSYIQCRNGETYYVLTGSSKYHIQIRVKLQRLTTTIGLTLPYATNEYV